MPEIRPLIKMGRYSLVFVLPKSWLKYIKSKLGFEPKEVMCIEHGDDLIVRAVVPSKKKGAKE
ncbi:hypothetical protein LCGC14_2405620 [marine sediment metagenome]|uniref:Uncharacterized protein n=1 Tax=marine sediment metagenome TaxID=412755 RepID=A0A0F9BU05_9ZZZZ